MATVSVNTVEEDMRIVTEAFLSGRPIPPDVAERIEERASEFRTRILREQGELDLSDLYDRQYRETGH